MLGTRSFARLQVPKRVKAVLRLETFVMAAVLLGVMQSRAQMGPPTNQRPVMVEFWAGEIGLGQYAFWGRITDENPSTCRIHFGGIPSLNGKSCAVLSDGTFYFICTVKTDGTDDGVGTGYAKDAQGLQSDVDGDVVSITRPPPGG